jgi:probable HAF family extracellular repeat protein
MILRSQFGAGLGGYAVRLSLTLATLALALAAGSVAAQSYNVTDLGTLEANGRGGFCQAYSINVSGQVSGAASASSNVAPAFLYSGGQMTSLGTLGGEYGAGQGINASGEVAGYSTLADGTYRAFLFSGGQMMQLPTLGANYAAGYAINDAGQVVGVSALPNNEQHAFLYSGGQITDLGTLGEAPSTAYGINNRGVIVGYSYDTAGNFFGFIYRNGKMTQMGTLGGSWSLAYAINDKNQVTGQAYTPQNLEADAFLFSNGKMTDLGTLGGGSGSYGSGINNAGTVVGRATIKGGSYRAFFSVNGAQMQDLNTMIPTGTGWVLQEATAINDAGQITGYGTLHGLLHSFLLTPQ